MRKTVLALAIAGLLGSAAHARACEGGKVLFEDTFRNDGGGWSDKKAVSVGDGELTFTLPADDMQSNLNVMFNVEDADVCAEAVWPYGAAQDENPQILGAGILFWGEDNRSYYQFGILNNGRYWIARKKDGAWVGTIAANIDSPAINTAPVRASEARTMLPMPRSARSVNARTVAAAIR